MAQSVAGPEIERLIQLLARLPGSGPRSARRAALHLIKKRDTLLTPLSDAMRIASERIVVCSTCGNVDTADPCTICRDASARSVHPRGGRGRVRPLGARALRRRQRPLPRARRRALAARRRAARAPQPRPPRRPRLRARRRGGRSWRSTPRSTARPPPITSPSFSPICPSR